MLPLLVSPSVTMFGDGLFLGTIFPRKSLSWMCPGILMDPDLNLTSEALRTVISVKALSVLPEVVFPLEVAPIIPSMLYILALESNMGSYVSHIVYCIHGWSGPSGRQQRRLSDPAGCFRYEVLS